ncbi:MAG: S1/P1 nuclease [Armatimonadetes bacterium]|nr:S1/P1 nuclease [Armatimonadota bacterium]
MKMTSRCTIVAALTVVAATASAWSDAGHGAIVFLAYRHLTPEVRAKVDVLLKVGVDKKYAPLEMAAIWADATRTDENGPWHYINVHFRTDGKPVTNQALEENVVWAIDRFTKQLADATLTEEQRADALRYVLHFVGDAHQPLHNVARDTERYPNGDRGGNEFAIKPGNGLPSWTTNLHRVWDSGCGAFALPMRAGEEGFVERAEELADVLAGFHAREDLDADVRNLDPKAWIRVGSAIAITSAYVTEEGGTPSTLYLRSGQRICMRRAALAAYRLAEILNIALAD